MPRPRKCRHIANTPMVTYFKPQGIPMRELDEVCLAYEGYEAILLSDLQGLTQEEAAQRMGVSRHTFGRVLAEARKVIAEAIVNGLALRIQGGNYVIGRCRHRAGGPHPSCGFEVILQNSAPNDAVQTDKEHSMQKIAVSSEGPTLDDQVDPRFGRAAGFVLVDLETMETQYIDNGQTQMMAQGAGIQAAELIARAGVGCLLTGYVGPKAFRALSAAGIKVAQNLEGLTVREAVERFKGGAIDLAEGPNREAGR